MNKLLLFLLLDFSNFHVFGQWLNIGPRGEALSSISFRNANDGWVCGANGTLFRTFDGGSTWQDAVEFPAPHSTNHNRLLSVTTPLQYDVAVLTQQPSATEPTAVYYSTRNGYVFSVVDVGYADFTFLSSHTDKLAILVGNNGALHISPAQGRAWQVLSSGTQNDLFGADSPDGDIYYLVGSKGTLRKGLWSSTATSHALNSTTFARLTGVWFVDAQQGYIIGDGGTALRTTDGGTTWLPMPVNTSANLNAVRFLNATTGFIVGDLGTLLLTTDGGLTWHYESSNTFETLNGIYATPDGLNTWVVGGGGTVLKRGAVLPLASRSGSKDFTWQVYPNPFTTSLTLVLTHGDVREVRLLDPMGRLVLHQAIESGSSAETSYSLPLPSGLAPGIYSLQVVASGHSPEVRRLVRLP